MNSDKAADVRDAINSLPCVAYDPEPHPNYPSDGHTRVTQHGPESLHTGETCKLDQFQFCPAEVRQAGEIGFGDNPTMRPLYEVVLRPLVPPYRPLPTVSIPPAVVHEVAKYSCRVRVEAGYRGESQPGLLKIRDDLAHEANADRDGDRCPSCRSTRFRVKDGTLECARCGNRVEDEEAEAAARTLDSFAGGESR